MQRPNSRFSAGHQGTRVAEDFDRWLTGNAEDFDRWLTGNMDTWRLHYDICP
jgi:hypothetical protein